MPCLLLAFLFLQPVAAHSQQGLTLSTVDQIGEDFTAVQCRNKDRLPAAQGLFEKMGAPESAITIEKLSGNQNLLLRLEGDSPQTIVIGAHYDLEEAGCGAIDNWSGVVAIAHLYKAIRQLKTHKTFLFVAFDREEKGLLGSKAMVQKIPKDELPRYCAMINIDSFGSANPFALASSSSDKLVKLSAELANQMKIPFYDVRIPGADTDSTSFIQRKIPAVTLSGLSNDWQSILHTRNDQAMKVNPVSVYLGYRLALTLASRMDESDCGAYR